MFLAFVVLINHSCRIDLGDWAVYTFFILSGYWIQRLWTGTYSKTGSPTSVFLASRLMRLLPVFWMANALSALVQHWIDPTFLHPEGTGWHWAAAAASNLIILGYANLPHEQGALHAAWSLDIEMQFYLAFAAAMFVFSRTGRHGWVGKAIGLASLFGVAAFLAQVTPTSRHLGFYGMFFLIGVLSERGFWSPTISGAWVSLAIVAALIVLCLLDPGMRYLVENAKHGATAAELHYKRMFQFALAFVSAPLALLTVRNPSGAIDRRLSELTYVVYLVQWPVMTLHSFYFVHLAPFERVPSVLGAWVVVGLASWIVFSYVDRPLEGARRRWVLSKGSA